MNKTTIGINSFLLKVVCLAMILALGASLIGTVAMASATCGMKCCCQMTASHMQSSSNKQIRSPMGCCSGTPLKPCNIEPARPIKLPEITRASCCWQLTHVVGASATFSAFNDPGLNIDSNALSQILDPNFNSPPLFLQKASFLI